MATLLPALRKDWQVTRNVLIAGASAESLHKALMFETKQALKGMPLFPWAILGSGNGVGGAMDAVDRWTAGGDVPTGGWVVMRQAALGTVQLLWQHGSAGGSPWNWDVWVSPAVGFSGGGPTTRPTASDEFRIQATSIDDTEPTTTAVYVNAAVSTDGKANRWWAFQGGHPIHFGLFDLLENAIAELTTPWIAMRNGGPVTSGVQASSYSYLNANTRVFGRQGATTLEYRLASANPSNSGGGDRIGQATYINKGVNQLSGDYCLAPVAVSCATALHLGLHGELVDLWYSPETAANGDTYPEGAFTGDGGLDQLVQVGDLVLPWLGDGTAPLTGGAASTRRPGRVLYLWQSFDPDAEEEEEVVAAAQPTAVDLPPIDPDSELGVDFDVLDNFGKAFVLTSGQRNLANALARQLQTPKGFFALAFEGDPDYGYDLRSMLNSANTPAGIGAIESKTKAACERDERVREVDVSASYALATQLLTVQIDVDSAAGPFRLVLKVSQLSTEVVLAPEG